MVFNYLIGNKDDHAKKISFIFDRQKWVLSQAYDLVPSNGIRGLMTTSINKSFNPKDNDLIEVAKIAGLDQKKAMAFLQQ